MTKIGDFMKGSGAIPEVPAAKDYISDEFMKMVNADPKLREFANRSN